MSRFKGRFKDFKLRFHDGFDHRDHDDYDDDHDDDHFKIRFNKKLDHGGFDRKGKGHDDVEDFCEQDVFKCLKFKFLKHKDDIVAGGPPVDPKDLIAGEELILDDPTFVGNGDDPINTGNDTAQTAPNLISVVGLDDGLVFSGVIPSENGLNPRLLEGPNVLIGENRDGRKIVIEFVGPAWVETLMNDYGFSIEKDFRSDPPLEARTAPLWQQLGY